MFGNKSKPSRIYSFGAKEPTVNLDIVLDQMRKGHQYRNKLVELERNRRKLVEDTIAKMYPRLAELTKLIEDAERRLEEVRANIKASNSKMRKKQPSNEDRGNATEIKKELKVLQAERKTLRKQAFNSEEWKEFQTSLNATSVAMSKKARAESELYWGTYLAVECTMSGCRSGAPPKFQRYQDEGRVCVQTTGGMSVQTFLTGNSKLVSIAPEEAGKLVDVLFRVGSTETGKPIFATVPTYISRELPADAKIKWAYLHRTKIGTQYEWKLQLVLSKDDWDREDWSGEGEVGIDVGWRLVETGLRVAYWVGSDGEKGELVIPHDVIGRWRHCAELRSTQDTHFNIMRTILCEWIKQSGAIPEWLKEETTGLAQWKSPERLARVVEKWRDNRFDGDNQLHELAESLRKTLHLQPEHYGTPTGMFDLMEAWRKKWKHLYNWERSQDVKATRYRQHLYRNFAAMLCRKYRTAHVEKLNLKAMQEYKPVEQEAEPQAVREYRKIAGCSYLLQFIREAMQLCVQHEPANTTAACHACGELTKFPNPEELMHTCQSCGEVFDQDENAARNLLSGCERSYA